ncbi:hypothetical protein ACLB1M_11890 [Escherichia coli]
MLIRIVVMMVSMLPQLALSGWGILGFAGVSVRDGKVRLDAAYLSSGNSCLLLLSPALKLPTFWHSVAIRTSAPVSLRLNNAAVRG